MSLSEIGHGAEDRCTRCGACLAVCPVYNVLGHERFSPRARVQLARVCQQPDHAFLSASRGFRDAFTACLQCGACDSVCNAGVDTSAIIRSVREEFLVQKEGWKGHLLDFLGTAEKSKLSETVFAMLARIPVESGLWQRFSSFGARKTGRIVPLPAPESFLAQKDRGKKNIANAKTVFFTGCIQNYLYPEIAEKVDALFSAELIIPVDQGCCGLPAWASGYRVRAQETVRRNLNIILANNPEAVMTACSSCAFMIKQWPELFEPGSEESKKARHVAGILKTFDQMALEHGCVGSSVALPLPADARVAYHISCHERFFLKDHKRRLEALKKITGRKISPVESCCGGGGFFSVSCSGLSRDVFARLRVEFAGKYDVILASCSGCLLQMRSLLHKSSLTSEETQAPLILHASEMLSARKL